MSTRRVVIFGAGAMGSALATPFRVRGWEVSLWGTWLDDRLVEKCRAGEPHPRTGELLPEGTRLYTSSDMASASADADLAVLAVASVGVSDVVKRIAHAIDHVPALLLTSKGFSRGEDGHISLLPEAIRSILRGCGVEPPPIVAIGGPCKANEVASSRPTATIYGCAHLRVAQRVAGDVETGSYRITVSSDEVGIEVSAAMKNVYAIALGVADGLGDRDGKPWHNLKAAVFNRAAYELSVLTEIAGGDKATPYGLAGIGDLEVTGLSGRNKVFGARIGRGQHADAALAEMAAAEQTVEGVQACQLGVKFVDQQDNQSWPKLRLLRSVAQVLRGAPDPASLITRAALGD